MAVSAPGSLSNTGRVYLYKYTGTSARTNTQILTFNGTVAVNFLTNVISFSTNHNYLNGNPVLYINGNQYPHRVPISNGKQRASIIVRGQLIPKELEFCQRIDDEFYL
jgi:hypothetical protein